uniref:Uncharacterized protein n=1 Tax=Panagrolaimus davidi TaxID=227884 RepID=A0A914PHU3_9BILA
MGGKSRNNAFVQLPTKFVEDICYTALVGTGFSEDMAEWSPDEDDVYKGACTRVGLKVQSSLGKRRPSKTSEKTAPMKKFKSIVIDSEEEDEAAAE